MKRRLELWNLIDALRFVTQLSLFHLFPFYHDQQHVLDVTVGHSNAL